MTPGLAGVSTGVGTSRNIVMDSEEYYRIAKHLYQLDDVIGQCAYQTALDIEKMCETTYIMPLVNAQIRQTTELFKSMLYEGQAMSEALMTQTRRYAEEIVEIE
jgi:hypothetical protein